MLIGSDVFFVSAVLPCGDLLDQGQLVGDTPIETLARQHAEFRLSHVQPAAVLWRIVLLEPLDETACLGGGKGFVERRRLVGVEIVPHEHDFSLSERTADKSLSTLA